jgi:hypothetical protein
MMLYRSVIVCVNSGTTPAANTKKRRNYLRNGRSLSFYSSIRIFIKDFVVINDDVENIWSLE